mgnify:CR=1 FL=1
MDSSAGGYNTQSLSTMGNSGAQFSAQQSRSAAMLEYEEPDMKRKDMDDQVNDGLGTSGSLSKFGKGAKDFYSKYQEIKGKAQAASNTVQAAGQGVSNALGGNSSLGQMGSSSDGAASKALQAQHKTAVQGMDDATGSATKAKIQADPIAGKNPNVAGTSVEDRNAILNKRSDIINDASGNKATQGVRGVDQSVDDLGGDTMGAANKFVSSQGSFMSKAVNGVKNMFGGASSTSQAGADISNSVRAAANNGINGARGAMANGASNLHANITGAGNDLTQGASKVAGAADDALQTGAKVASGLSKAAEVGGTVLDALGPVGDLLGLGMAIFGGVEATHQEGVEKRAQATAESAMSAPVTAGQGAGGAMTTATLDTSHPGQAVAQSHY